MKTILLKIILSFILAAGPFQTDDPQEEQQPDGGKTLERSQYFTVRIWNT